MGALAEFIGAPKEIEIEGKKLKLYPLKLKHLKELKVEPDKKLTPKETEEITKTMLRLSLQDVTDEELEELPLVYQKEIMQEINKFNGFENAERDERIRQFNENLKKS